MNLSLAEKISEIKKKQNIEGVRVGHITDIDDAGHVLVDYPGNTQGPTPARFTHSMTIETLKRAQKKSWEILLVFENSNPDQPIIIDVLSSLIDDISDAEDDAGSSDVILTAEETQDVTIDGKRVAFNAHEKIVLTCGKASITLTKAGKIIIRGAYVLNRSSGVNKIKGGSVQIN